MYYICFINYILVVLVELYISCYYYMNGENCNRSLVRTEQEWRRPASRSQTILPLPRPRVPKHYTNISLSKLNIYEVAHLGSL